MFDQIETEAEIGGGVGNLEQCNERKKDGRSKRQPHFVQLNAVNLRDWPAMKTIDNPFSSPSGGKTARAISATRH